MNNSCCTITRYYGKNEKDLEQLYRFIQQAQTYSNRIIIGVNIEKDLTNCIEKYSQLTNIPVDFIPIKPWIGISTPLNILLNHISSNEKFVLIQSVEIQCTSYHINYLQSYFKENDLLCIGVALDGHQNFDSQSNPMYLPLQGDTSPWNTFILWNLEKLRRTGFPLCSDFVNPPGMEDSAVIGLQQKLFGGMKNNRALLINFEKNIHWLNEFESDEERLLKHQIKMKSKNSRTKQLLEILNISENDQIGIEYISELENFDIYI